MDLEALAVKHLMAVVLAGFGFLILLVVWLFHRDSDNKFDLTDLVCGPDGKANERKFCRFGAWIVSTWGFVFLAMDGKLTEWYFAGYMGAWVASAILGKMAGKEKPASES